MVRSCGAVPARCGWRATSPPPHGDHQCASRQHHGTVQSNLAAVAAATGHTAVGDPSPSPVTSNPGRPGTPTSSRRWTSAHAGVQVEMQLTQRQTDPRPSQPPPIALTFQPGRGGTPAGGWTFQPAGRRDGGWPQCPAPRRGECWMACRSVPSRAAPGPVETDRSQPYPSARPCAGCWPRQRLVIVAGCWWPWSACTAGRDQRAVSAVSVVSGVRPWGRADRRTS